MKNLSKRNRFIIIAISIILIACIVVTAWGFIENNMPVVTEYTVDSDRLPDEFKGYKIAQVSDLHNSEIGKDNQKLLNALKSADPDVILLTGDLIDSRRLILPLILLKRHARLRLAIMLVEIMSQDYKILIALLKD